MGVSFLLSNVGVYTVTIIESHNGEKPISFVLENVEYYEPHLISDKKTLICFVGGSSLTVDTPYEQTHEIFTKLAERRCNG